MAPLVVQWVTPGAKLYGTKLLMQDHIPTHCCEILTQAMSPLHPCLPEGLWVICRGQLELWKGLLVMDVRVLNRMSSYMWNNWNVPMLLLRNRSLTLMYMTSDGSCNVVHLCAHNGEVVHPGMMTCTVGIITDMGRTWDVHWAFL